MHMDWSVALGLHLVQIRIAFYDRKAARVSYQTVGY